jgi:hypothetical protein
MKKSIAILLDTHDKMKGSFPPGELTESEIRKSFLARAVYACITGVLFAALAPANTAHGSCGFTTTWSAGNLHLGVGYTTVVAATYYNVPGDQSCQHITLQYQNDGDLVLYVGDPGYPIQYLWYSEHTSPSPDHASWQSDGNLVTYDTSHSAYWASNTANSGYTLNFQWDCNMVIRNSSGTPIWASNSNLQYCTTKQ